MIELSHTAEKNRKTLLAQNSTKGKEYEHKNVRKRQ